MVCHLDICRTLIGPAKAKPELIVHPDRMLADAIPAEHFEPVRRRQPEIRKRPGSIHHDQLSPNRLDQIGRKSLRNGACKNQRQTPVTERDDCDRRLPAPN
jgi:hypothetical protein